MEKLYLSFGIFLFIAILVLISGCTGLQQKITTISGETCTIQEQNINAQNFIRTHKVEDSRFYMDECGVEQTSLKNGCIQLKIFSSFSAIELPKNAIGNYTTYLYCQDYVQVETATECWNHNGFGFYRFKNEKSLYDNVTLCW